MLKINDYIKLIDAGFTSEDIKAIINMDQSTNNKVDSKDPLDDSTTDNKDPQNDNTIDLENKINILSDNINKLGQLLVASNINKSNMPEQTKTEDILANIINPPIYNKGDKNNG